MYLLQRNNDFISNVEWIWILCPYHEKWSLKMIELPKIYHGLSANCAKEGSRAFDEKDPNLTLFYKTIHTKLWEQYKTCIEVSNWVYVTKQLGPPTILVGATGYAFYNHIFGKDASASNDEIKEKTTLLEETKDQLQKFFSTAKEITKIAVQRLIATQTSIPVEFIEENQNTIIAVLKGLSFTLATGWLAYKTITYNKIKAKADNYKYFFEGNFQYTENVASNIAEYTTFRFSRLITQISSRDEVKIMANRFLKQFAYNLGQGRPFDNISLTKFVIASIAPINGQIIDEIWKKNIVCICPCKQDKTISLRDGKKVNYEEFATKSPLIFFYIHKNVVNGVVSSVVSTKLFDKNNKHRTINTNIPSQAIISEEEILEYGFTLSKL